MEDLLNDLHVREIIMAYPGARIYALDEYGINETSYRGTPHCRISRHFLDIPRKCWDFCLTVRIEAGG